MAECLSQFFGSGEWRSKGPVGMDLFVSGTVPPGSGLSVCGKMYRQHLLTAQSSAAVVVASVTTFLVANGLIQGITKSDVVRLAMASEHRMGLRTGGMDVGGRSPSWTDEQQAASALCLPNTLLHLAFHPQLHPEPLPLPVSLAIVIANSLSAHALTDTAPEQYNLRVVESLCAARLLLHAWGLSNPPKVSASLTNGNNADTPEHRLRSGPEKGRLWLKEVLEVWIPDCPDEEVYERALSQLDEVLGVDGRGEKGWTREEMIEASGMSASDFTATYLEFLESEPRIALPFVASADPQSEQTASTSSYERDTPSPNPSACLDSPPSAAASPPTPLPPIQPISAPSGTCSTHPMSHVGQTTTVHAPRPITCPGSAVIWAR